MGLKPPFVLFGHTANDDQRFCLGRVPVLVVLVRHDEDKIPFADLALLSGLVYDRTSPFDHVVDVFERMCVKRRMSAWFNRKDPQGKVWGAVSLRYRDLFPGILGPFHGHLRFFKPAEISDFH
jgi:hypothetical protein